LGGKKIPSLFLAKIHPFILPFFGLFLQSVSHFPNQFPLTVSDFVADSKMPRGKLRFPEESLTENFTERV
jgi:hypothetical protein